MTPRRTSSINRGWRFRPAPLSDSTGPEQPVTLPHSNVTLPATGFDDRTYQFVSSYRRRLRLQADAEGQRVLARFDGAMTKATVECNGVRLAEHRGGFVPFTVELTSALQWDGEDELQVELDSTELPDVPPFGGHLDYLTFGGLYRGVELLLVPPVHLADVFARPRDVRTADRLLEVRYEIDATAADDLTGLSVEADVLDDGSVVSTAVGPVEPHSWTGGRACGTVVVAGLQDVRLWDVDDPALYSVPVRLVRGSEVVDATEVRTGFREARFTPDGFFLNGRRVQLRGLNRHQTFPYVGAAMPDRVQRRDAEILRRELHCTAVRTSHYPQSPAFLDACDELGLLVFEEMPGWQHLGEESWQDLACRDVAAMVVRDRNHPSVILWGVRVNESLDSDEFYRRTNALAHSLDDSRQTSGVRYFRDSRLLEDVFALNDFQTGGLLDPPHHPGYLVSEYAGHMFPTKRFDNVSQVQEHALLHATVLEHLYADPRIAGGFGWCAFDYATHAEFGSGDRVCYHGVADMFRVPKPAASVYRSQCDPAEEVVLEPAFLWAGGDASDYGGPGAGAIFSNCDRIVVYLGQTWAAELTPDRSRFPSLPHPPFFFDAQSGIAPWRRQWGDLHLEGYLRDQLVVTRTLSGSGVDRELLVTVDDDRMDADGADATRLLIRVGDGFGNVRPYARGVVRVDVDGPLQVVGENPLALTGGVAAVWLRASEEPGEANVTVGHPQLGAATVRIQVAKTPGEPW